MPARGALGAYIRIDGLAEAREVVDTFAEAAEAMGRFALAVGSPLPYAMGIETGRTRGGGVARRAGGASMLRDGVAAMQAEIPSLIAAEFERGAGVGQAVEQAIRRTALTQVQRRTPVRTGRLRDSFTVKRGRR